MAMVTLGEAARLTGLGKTTLARAIKAGRLSAARTDIGTYQIDPAELARVYPFPAPTEPADETGAATPTRPMKRPARLRPWRRRSPDCARSVSFCGGSSTTCGRTVIDGARKPNA